MHPPQLRCCESWLRCPFTYHFPHILGPPNPCNDHSRKLWKIGSHFWKVSFWHFGTKNRVSRMRRQSLLLEPCKRMTTLSLESDPRILAPTNKQKKCRSVRILVRAEKKRRAFPFTLTKSMHAKQRIDYSKMLKS